MPSQVHCTGRCPVNARAIMLAAALVLALAGCASTSSTSGTHASVRKGVGAGRQSHAAGSAQLGEASLASASGSLVSGKLTLTPMGAGVHVTGEVGGFRPGSSHGFHIHENGDCSAVDGSSAGGHFNPAGLPHGRAMQRAHHAGDADNIVADANGVAKVDTHILDVTLGGGGSKDVAGRAIVVHAAPDDYASQPAGNAGARVACGVIKVVR